MNERWVSKTVGLEGMERREIELTLVEATPISGPALMWTPQWDSREMVDPTVRKEEKEKKLSQFELRAKEGKEGDATNRC